MDQWSLQMNCIDNTMETPTVMKIIDSLKKSTLNNVSFVSVCNGLMFLIEHSEIINQSKSLIAKELFAVYKHFARLPDLPSSKIPASSSYTQFNSPYKKVWIL